MEIHTLDPSGKATAVSFWQQSGPAGIIHVLIKSPHGRS